MRRLLCFLGYLLVVMGGGLVVMMFFMIYKEYHGGNELTNAEELFPFIIGAFLIFMGLNFIKEYKERL